MAGGTCLSVDLRRPPAALDFPRHLQPVRDTPRDMVAAPRQELGLGTDVIAAGQSGLWTDSMIVGWCDVGAIDCLTQPRLAGAFYRIERQALTCGQKKSPQGRTRCARQDWGLSYRDEMAKNRSAA
jgi:hypothetical protein